MKPSLLLRFVICRTFWMVVVLTTTSRTVLRVSAEPAPANIGNTIEQAQEAQEAAAAATTRTLRTTDASTTATTTASPVVVSLGDSFIGGTGFYKKANKYDDPWCFVNYDTRTPGGRYAAARGLEHLVVACAGATLNDTLGQWQDLHYRRSELLQDDSSDNHRQHWNRSLILVSAGGNSAVSARGESFLTSLLRGLLSPLYHNYNSDQNQIGNLDEIQDQAEHLYETLTVQAAGATVRVLGYPLFMNPGRFLPVCFATGFWQRRKAQFVDDLIGSMNGALQTAVRNVQERYPAMDLEFIDVGPYFSNGACFPLRRRRQINGLVPRFLWASYHPNQRGYNRIYDAILDNLQ